MQPWYLWIIPVAFAWPLLQLIVGVARFGRLPPPDRIADSLVFFPMGLLSAAVLCFLMHRATSRQRKLSTLVGYLGVSPCALVGSLLSGLMYPQPWGTLLYGAIPLVLGAIGGYLVGKVWDASSARDT